MGKTRASLDTRSDVRRWNPILGGLLAAGAGVAFAFAVPAGPLLALPAALLALGVWLASIGVRAKASTVTEAGIRRVGWTGEETVPWDDVRTIEADVVFADRDSFGRIRIHRRGGGRFSIHTTATALPATVDRLAERCPDAVIDDRVSGEITPPRRESPDAAERTEAARRRARRGLGATAILWIGAAVVLLPPSLGCLGYGLAKGKPELILAGSTGVFGGGAAVWVARTHLLLRRG